MLKSQGHLRRGAPRRVHRPLPLDDRQQVPPHGRAPPVRGRRRVREVGLAPVFSFGVLGFGLGVWGLEFGVWGLGFRVQGLGFRVYGL